MNVKMDTPTAINSSNIAAYVRELEFTNSELSEIVKRLQEEAIDPQKFYGTAISVDACARIHGVCAQTVRQYIHAGYIPKHPDSTDHKLLIRTSDALILDFRKLKMQNKRN